MEFFATKILIVATRLPSFAQTQAIRAYFSCLANSLESSTSSSSSMYTMATFLSRTKFKFFSQHAQMSFDAAVGKERSPQLGAQRRTGCFVYSLLIICFSWSWRNLSRSTFNTTVSKKYLSALPLFQRRVRRRRSRFIIKLIWNLSRSSESNQIFASL